MHKPIKSKENMYSVISSVATPLIVINLSRVYFAWMKMVDNRNNITHEQWVGEKDQIYKTQRVWNAAVSISIFAVGATSVYLHATKFQNPTPLIMSAMGYRLAALFLISAAVWSSGNAFNHFWNLYLGN